MGACRRARQARTPLARSGVLVGAQGTSACATVVVGRRRRSSSCASRARRDALIVTSLVEPGPASPCIARDKASCAPGHACANGVRGPVPLAAAPCSRAAACIGIVCVTAPRRTSARAREMSRRYVSALSDSSSCFGTMPRAALTSRMSEMLLRLAASCSSMLSPNVCSTSTSRSPSCSCTHSGCCMMTSCAATSSDAFAPRASAPPSRRARSVRNAAIASARSRTRFWLR